MLRVTISNASHILPLLQPPNGSDYLNTVECQLALPHTPFLVPKIPKLSRLSPANAPPLLLQHHHQHHSHQHRSSHR